MIQTTIEVEKLFSMPEKISSLAGSSVLTTVSLAFETVKGFYSKTPDKRLGYYIEVTHSGLKHSFWEIKSFPVNSVQTYRALKLASECPRINDDTLCACHYAMQRKLDGTARHYLKSLQESGFTNVEERRDTILSEGIDEPYFVKNFLQPLFSHGIIISSEEFQNEVTLGTFAPKIVHFSAKHTKQSVV